MSTPVTLQPYETAVLSQPAAVEAPSMDYPSTVRSLAPVAYWRLGEAAGSATVAEDAGGPSGTVSGGVTLGVPGLLTGDADTAASFDGATGKITFGDVYDFAGSDPLGVPLPFSVSLLFQRTSGNDGTTRQLVYKGFFNGNTDRGGWNIQIGGDNSLRFNRYNSTQGQTTSSNPTASVAGTTYHVVVTYDGVTMRMYVDGALVHTVNSNVVLPDTTYPLTIGQRADTAGGLYAGAIDELAIWDREVTADEVTTLYTASSTAPAQPSAKLFVVDTADLVLRGQVAVPAQLTVTDSVTLALAPATERTAQLAIRDTAGLALAGQVTTGTADHPATLRLVETGGLALNGVVAVPVRLVLTDTAGLALTGNVDHQLALAVRDTAGLFLSASLRQATIREEFGGMRAGYYDLIIEQGAVFRRVLTLATPDGTPLSLAGYTPAMQIRRQTGDTEVVLDLSQVAGALTIDATANTLTIEIPATVTSMLPAPPGGLRYDLELTPPSGPEDTIRLLEGFVRVSAEVTRAA